VALHEDLPKELLLWLCEYSTAQFAVIKQLLHWQRGRHTAWQSGGGGVAIWLYFTLQLPRQAPSQVGTHDHWQAVIHKRIHLTDTQQTMVKENWHCVFVAE
jgi:hypothetical protein